MHTLKNYQSHLGAIPRISVLGRLLVSRLVEEIKGLDLGRTESIELVSYYCFLFFIFVVIFDICLSIQSDKIGA
jgi:hypothetical protein